MKRNSLTLQKGVCSDRESCLRSLQGAGVEATQEEMAITAPLRADRKALLLASSWWSLGGNWGLSPVMMGS